MELQSLHEDEQRSFEVNNHTYRIGDWIEIDGYPLQAIHYRGRFNFQDAFIFDDRQLPDANGVVFGDRPEAHRAPRELRRALSVKDLGVYHQVRPISDIFEYSKQRNYQW